MLNTHATGEPHRSVAYGLGIQSYLPMPEFVPSEAEPDVTIRFERIAAPDPPSHLPPGTAYRAVYQTGDGVLMHWSPIGSFLVSGGRDVAVCPVDGADEGLLRMVLTGPALAVLLAQRGEAVFHAGAVAHPVSGAGVAVAARSGVGKSTMITALHNAGFSLVADDILSVTLPEETSHEPLAVPGFPHAKLWRESAEALVADPDSLVPLSSETPKLARPITERFAQAPVPLTCVFVLADGPELLARRLSGHAAVGALLPHWYGACMNGQLMGVLGRERHLREATALAAAVRVYELTRPRVLERLPEVVTMIRDVVERDGDGRCP